MRLSELLSNADVLSNFSDREITDVTDTTHRLKKGCAFVCIKGNTVDGHRLYKKALEAGAAAIIAQENLETPLAVKVQDTKKAYALMCKAFFGNACDRLSLIGVTGTNGKTSVSFMIKGILRELSVECGLFGTLGCFTDECLITGLTTPCPYELHKMFKALENKGIRYCVLEASSQALHQQRLYGITFDVGVFTNLTRDHLDYHKSLNNYKACKKLLFKSSKKAVVNGDDENAAYISEGFSGDILTYGKGDCDLKATDIRVYSGKTEFLVSGIKAAVNTPGEFSVYNSLAALGAVSLLGFPLEEAARALLNVMPVKGRLERLSLNTDFSVILDYAHTPDGLKNAIEAVKSTSSGRVISVFGCGGERDRGKRPIMGFLASRLSDIVIITSDNPRGENAEAIIEDIYEGAKRNEGFYALIPSRRDGIAFALKCARRNDTVLLLGKGHEKYQLIGGKRYEFDEEKTVKSILKKGFDQFEA